MTAVTASYLQSSLPPSLSRHAKREHTTHIKHGYPPITESALVLWSRSCYCAAHLSRQHIPISPSACHRPDSHTIPLDQPPGFEAGGGRFASIPGASHPASALRSNYRPNRWRDSFYAPLTTMSDSTCVLGAVHVSSAPITALCLLRDVVARSHPPIRERRRYPVLHLSPLAFRRRFPLLTNTSSASRHHRRLVARSHSSTYD